MLDVFIKASDGVYTVLSATDLAGNPYVGTERYYIFLDVTTPKFFI